MRTFLETNFKDLKIESPLFFAWPIGIRFEIGPSEIPMRNSPYSEAQMIEFATTLADIPDLGTLNIKYFDAAFNRAVSIFESVFEPNDEIAIIYQEYSDGEDIDNKLFIFDQIDNIQEREVVFSDERDIYVEDLETIDECYKRVCISDLRLRDIHYRNILLRYIYNDRQGQCFFINIKKLIILHLYDVRGMDVIAKDKTSLQALYKDKNDWILDVNREYIDTIFSD